MSEQHTPGPWQTNEYYNEDVVVTDERGFVIVEAKHMPILLGWHEKLGIDHWADRSGEAYIELAPEAQAANARLIAAAPDLLDALKQAERWLEGWESAEPYLSTIRSAIAKATGGAA